MSILGVKNSILEAAANDAVTLALKKLADPRCQRIFTDFRDRSGHPLQRQLDSLGHTGAGFLRILRFANGVGLLPCQSRGVLAATTPLSHVIFLCGTQFFERQRLDPEYGAALVIHETLHALGLGENPPASNEITMGVIARCGARALGVPIDATALLRPSIRSSRGRGFFRRDRNQRAAGSVALFPGRASRRNAPTAFANSRGASSSAQCPTPGSATNFAPRICCERRRPSDAGSMRSSWPQSTRVGAVMRAATSS